MSTELFIRAESLRARRVPFVLATVVRAERPSSGRPGDRAIVHPDGVVEGFVGGSCVAETLRAQGDLLLKAGGTTLLRITPTAPTPDDTVTLTSTPGLLVVHNHCLSGGTLDIFLEAVMPPALMHVFGDTPIATALQAVGTAAGFEVASGAAPDAQIPSGTEAVVVASHGHDEAEVLIAALEAGVPYVALVASPKRGAAVIASLDVRADQAARIKTPAGLDIGAATPGEVAVSVLAELINRRSRTITVRAL